MYCQEFDAQITGNYLSIETFPTKVQILDESFLYWKASNLYLWNKMTLNALLNQNQEHFLDLSSFKSLMQWAEWSVLLEFSSKSTKFPTDYSKGEISPVVTETNVSANRNIKIIGIFGSFGLSRFWCKDQSDWGFLQILLKKCKVVDWDLHGKKLHYFEKKAVEKAQKTKFISFFG